MFHHYLLNAYNQLGTRNLSTVAHIGRWIDAVTRSMEHREKLSVCDDPLREVPADDGHSNQKEEIREDEKYIHTKENAKNRKVNYNADEMEI